MLQATYNLETIKALIQKGEFFITVSAQQGARQLGFDHGEIVECVLVLGFSDFYKTMPSEKIPGLFQDVYRPEFKGKSLYVKLQVTSKAVVISFKEK